MFSSVSLCTFIRAKFEHLVLAILPVSRTGICWFCQLKRIILASAINLGGAGLRPTAPRSSKNLMGPRPNAPRSQDRPCMLSILVFYVQKFSLCFLIFIFVFDRKGSSFIPRYFRDKKASFSISNKHENQKSLLKTLWHFKIPILIT